MSFYAKNTLDGETQPCQWFGYRNRKAGQPARPTDAGFFVPVNLGFGRVDTAEYKTGESREYAGKLALRLRLTPGCPIKAARKFNNHQKAKPMKITPKTARKHRVQVSAFVKREFEVSLDDPTDKLILFYEAFKNLRDYPSNRPTIAFVHEVSDELNRRAWLDLQEGER